MGSLTFDLKDVPDSTATLGANTVSCGAQGTGVNRGDGAKPTIRSNDHVLGNANAAVTVVEYTDFECPTCGNFVRTQFPAIRTKFIDTGKVCWVFRHYLNPTHRRAEPAAIASECAADQGAFFPFADLTFATTGSSDQTILTNQQLQQNAAAIGLDMATFNACFLSTSSDGMRVREDNQSGTILGVDSTPTFFINDRKVVGFQTAEQMSELIEQKLGGTASR